MLSLSPTTATKNETACLKLTLPPNDASAASSRRNCASMLKLTVKRHAVAACPESPVKLRTAGVFTESAGWGRAEGEMLDFQRDAERERLRDEYCKAWRALRMIRDTIEKHTPEGTVPEQEFLADFPEEAAVLVQVLKRYLTQGSNVRNCNAVVARTT